jgi:uncharacterized protein with FMN-binding domain
MLDKNEVMPCSIVVKSWQPKFSFQALEVVNDEKIKAQAIRLLIEN